MNWKDLEGKRFRMGIGEPWEASEELAGRELVGVITDGGTTVNKYYGNREECLVARLDESFEYDGIICQYFVISPRYQGSRMSRLLDGEQLTCGVIRVTEEHAKSEERLDTSWWRGGGAFIATVRLL